MAAAVGKLYATLGLDSAQYEKGLKRAEKRVEKFARVQKQNFKKARKQINSLSKEMKVYSAVAVGGLALVVKHSIDAASATANAADKLGLTTEALGGLKYAAEQSGVSGDTMTMGLQRMTRRLAEAEQGTGEAVGAIKELGLSADALAKMSPDEQFKAITAAMGKIPSQSKKVKLAFKLFDSEGVALINTMKGGVAGLEAMQQQALDLGIALNATDSEKLRMAGDAADAAMKVFEGLGNKIALELSPYIEHFSKKLIQSAEESHGFADELWAAFDLAGKAIEAVVKVWNGWRLIIASTKVFANGFIAGLVKGLGWVGDKLEWLASMAGFDISPTLEPLKTLGESTQDALAQSIEEFNTLKASIESTDIRASMEKIKSDYNAMVAEVVKKKGKEETEADKKKREAILKGNKALDKAIRKMTVDKFEYEKDLALEQLNNDLQNNLDEEKAYKRFSLRIKAIDKDINLSHKDAFDKTVDSFSSMMVAISGENADQWTAIGDTIKNTMENLDIDYSNLFAGLTSEEVTKGLSAAAAIYTAGMQGQEAIKSGKKSRDQAIFEASAAGAASGGAMGGPWGAVIGGAAGAGLASMAPNPDKGSFGESGLGTHAQISDDALGSLKKYSTLFDEAFGKRKGDLLVYISNQVGEIVSTFLDLSGLPSSLATEFEGLAKSGYDVADAINTSGQDSYEARDAMAAASGSATNLSLTLAATGHAGDAATVAAIDLAIAWNRSGVELMKNISAYDEMITRLAAVDERTRGLANATAAQSLANNILANSTMFSTEQIQAASKAASDLNAIQQEQNSITQQLANSHNLTASEVEALTARQAELNAQAMGIEESLTGMTEGAGDAAAAVADTSDNLGQISTPAREAETRMREMGDASTIAAGKMGGLETSTSRLIKPMQDAAWEAGNLKKILERMPTGHYQLDWSMSGGSSAPSKAIGEAFVHGNNVPRMLHHGERILTAEENRRYRDGDPGGSAGPVNVGSIIVNAAPGQSAKEIAEQVRQELLKMSQRGKTVLDGRGVGVGVTG